MITFTDTWATQNIFFFQICQHVSSALCFSLLSIVMSEYCNLSFGASQFHVVKVPKKWTEAQQYCRQEFTDLAIKKVNSLIHNVGAGIVWIGLENGSSPRWQWSLADENSYRENETGFRNWIQNQPQQQDEECVWKATNGQWHHGNCKKKISKAGLTLHD